MKIEFGKDIDDEDARRVFLSEELGSVRFSQIYHHSTALFTILWIITQSPNEWLASISNHQCTSDNIWPFARATGKIISCFREERAQFIAVYIPRTFLRTCQTYFFDRKRTPCSTNGSSKRRNTTHIPVPKYQSQTEQKTKSRCTCDNVNIFIDV